MFRLLIVGVVVVTMGAGCAASGIQGDRPPITDAWGSPYYLPGEPTPGPNPCADSLYLSLKERPIDSLSDREYRYMMERDKACAEYQRDTNGDGSARASGGPDMVTTILCVIGALAVIGLLMPK